MFEHGMVKRELQSTAEGLIDKQRVIERSSAGAERGMEGMA